MTINVVEAATRIRERIHDRDGYTFDDAEVLRALDDAIRRIFTTLRTHGDEGGFDFDDVPVSSMTLVERNVHEYQIPEAMAAPELLEAMRGDGSQPYQIPQVPLEHKDISRGLVTGSGLTWNWGRRGTLQIRGALTGWPTVRMWFSRKIPPLFRATASGASTTTSLIVTSATGAFKPRDDLYTGFQFEATAGANNGLVRRCTAHAGTTLTVAAFGSTMASTAFAMLLPLADEHHEYLVELVTLTFLKRQGSEKEKRGVREELDQLAAGFETGIARRSGNQPPRFYSSRQVR